MLQQTTVQAVIPYYTKWMSLFPDVKTLNQAPLQQVLKAWQGLGYYQRAQNLHRASKEIVEKFSGQIPQDYTQLLNLPGLGPYTASAILSIAYDLPFFAIDANIRRIIMRLMRHHGKANPKVDKMGKEFMKPSLPKENMGLFNQAMMDLGALICRSKNPLCLQCPISEFCRAFQAGKQEIIPLPRMIEYKKIDTVIGILQKKDKFLIQKRTSKGLLADLWEFPGGKRKKGETIEHALRREISEEVSAKVERIQFLTKVKHAYTKYQVTLYAYLFWPENRPQLHTGTHKWVSLRDMRHYPFHSGNAKIIQFLERNFQ